MEWLTNYSGSFGKHNVKAMAGYSYQYSQYSGLNASNKDFPNDALGADRRYRFICGNHYRGNCNRIGICTDKKEETAGLEMRYGTKEQKTI